MNAQENEGCPRYLGSRTQNFSNPISTFSLFYRQFKGPEVVTRPARGQDRIEKVCYNFHPFLVCPVYVGISLYHGQI